MSQLKTMIVKPRELTQYERDQYGDDARVRIYKPADEGGQLIPAAGAIVLCNSYWNRRVKGGDVVLTTKSAMQKSLAAEVAKAAEVAAKAAAATKKPKQDATPTPAKS